MRFRSVTFGRGVVLLLLGMAVGTGLFLENWFSETNIRDQVVAALRERIAAPFELSPDVPSSVTSSPIETPGIRPTSIIR